MDTASPPMNSAAYRSLSGTRNRRGTRPGSRRLIPQRNPYRDAHIDGLFSDVACDTGRIRTPLSEP